MGDGGESEPPDGECPCRKSSDSPEPSPLSALDAPGLVKRFPACPCTAVSPPASGEDGDRPAGEDGAEPDPLDADGKDEGETGGGSTGPADTGGNSGASIAPTVPSCSEFDPAVIAANVGTDAKATSSATSSTYRRVGARKPSALYTPFRRLRMILRGGTSPSSSSGTAGHPSRYPDGRKINVRLSRLDYR